jgi:hypothetical protein
VGPNNGSVKDWGQLLEVKMGDFVILETGDIRCAASGVPAAP